MRGEFITKCQAGPIFCHNNISGDCLCQRIHGRFWQTVRHLIAVCLVKIPQASHPILHSLTIKGAGLPFRNENEKSEDRVGFLIQVQHPYKPQLFTEMHRWEDSDKLGRTCWQQACSHFSCASAISVADPKDGRLLCHAGCQSKLT